MGIAMGVLTTWLLNEDGLVWSLGHALEGVAGPDAGTINTAFQAREITAGFSHACALADDGGVWCWGSNQEGEVGTDDSPSRVPERVFP
jgi:alpha-tubulin suppressor-like RCC1 family protein